MRIWGATGTEMVTEFYFQNYYQYPCQLNWYQSNIKSLIKAFFQSCVLSTAKEHQEQLKTSSFSQCYVWSSSSRVIPLLQTLSSQPSGSPLFLLCLRSPRCMSHTQGSEFPEYTKLRLDTWKWHQIYVQITKVSQLASGRVRRGGAGLPYRDPFVILNHHQYKKFHWSGCQQRSKQFYLAYCLCWLLTGLTLHHHQQQKWTRKVRTLLFCWLGTAYHNIEIADLAVFNPRPRPYESDTSKYEQYIIEFSENICWLGCLTIQTFLPYPMNDQADWKLSAYFATKHLYGWTGLQFTLFTGLVCVHLWLPGRGAGGLCCGWNWSLHHWEGRWIWTTNLCTRHTTIPI